jgi:thiol-disulfide isomerase/thioredoxin
LLFGRPSYLEIRMIRRLAPLALVLLAAVGVSAAAPAGASTPAPRVEISSYAELATPLPYPYDEKANANAKVAAAEARARRKHKLLMIDLGGNWCGDCRILAATMDLPSLKSYVAAHYEVVLVDVGRFDRNLQIPAHYGITKRLEGVPSLLIVDPVTDKLLDPGQDAALQDARNMSPQSLADWLAQWPR